MAGPHTPRARAREAMLGEIKQQALAQLATEGPAELSMRAIARELGMVSSGLYRYYVSRDELLTQLIIDSYQELADALEQADQSLPARHYRRRWLARCAALRDWSRSQPHRFQLIYGSPVPGYSAPADTVAPAMAVIVAILRPVDDAAAAGALTPEPTPRSKVLRGQLSAVADGLELHLDPGALTRAVGGFAHLIGLLTLELGGHFVGGFEPADDLFAEQVATLGAQIGLPR